MQSPAAVRESPLTRQTAAAESDRTWPGTETLFDALSPKLLFYLRGLTGDDLLAEDLLQDLFVSLLKNERERGQQPLSAGYAFRAARNAAINARNTAARQQRITQDWQRWRSALMPVGNNPDEREEFERLSQALESIPDDQREIVLLRTHGDLSFAQIAAVLERPKSSVADSYSAALAQLRKFLEKDA